MSDNDSTTPITYRELPDIDGYRFGSDGSAQSCWEGSGPASHKTDRWHDLALNLGTGRKYLRICVKRRGRRIKVDLHPLVCEAFWGSCPPGLECCHKDDNPLNNAADNLGWGSRHQNIADRRRNGIQPLGEQCYQARLTTAKVKSIRERYAAGGVTMEQLAIEHGVSVQHISGIINRTRWKHVA